MALPWWSSQLASRSWGLGWVALQTWDWDRVEAVRKVFVRFEAGYTGVDHIGVGYIVAVRNEVVLLGEVHTEAVRTEVVPLEWPRTEDLHVEGGRTGLDRIEVGS